MIGIDERKDVGAGQMPMIPWQPSAVKAGQHQSPLIWGTVAGRELVRSDLPSKTITLYGMAGHVFISCAREDSEHIDQLRSVLETAGIPFWMHTSDLLPGDNWRAKIRAAIRADALAFLACFSRWSVSLAKGLHNEELALAVDELRLRKHDDPWLIPVRLDDCHVPDREIGGGLSLADLERVDLFGDDYAANVDRLVTAIRRILGSDPLSPAAGKVQNAHAPGDKQDQRARQAPKYVVDLRGSINPMVGDGNVQHNYFTG